ncbi:MAG: DUF3052 domain-containing protein [Actinomycetota bacterium]|nr:DUF3052 domain-containing protein [Actinomycetota bacterium]
MAGYSGTPLQKKLGMKPGHRVSFVNAPADFADKFTDVEVLARLRRPLDVVVLFATWQRDLLRRLPAAQRALTEDGGLWVAWPRKAAKVATDLDENAVRDLILSDVLVDNKICAIDETWSGLRFVYRRTARRAARATRPPSV